MRILFVNKTRADEFRAFDYANLEGMRGGERTVMQLAEALGQRGHGVVVACGGVKGARRVGNMTVAGPEAALAANYDVVVSNNFAKAFDGVKAPIKIVWTHNPGFSWAHVRADFAAKWRHRPYLVHLSQYTLARSRLLPRSGQTVIRHGMPSVLLAARQLRSEAPAPVAVFSSYAGRNLSRVIGAWRDVVHQSVPSARLLVTSEVKPKHLAGMTAVDLERLNIEIVGTLPWTRLMALLRTARVFVAPGHRQETYNLLSVEAAACGVPTVTMGIGALRERVVQDETGWIAASNAEMGAAMVRVLADDALWLRYHRACLEHPDLVSWEQRAGEWERYMEELGRQRLEGRADI
ncbi:MAG: glycosyltransferase family 4 protein [Hyphomicrobium sp.]